MSAAHELILARIEDVEDYVDRELDELEETDRILAFMNTIEARERHEADDELSRRLDALEAEHAREALQEQAEILEARLQDPEYALQEAINLERVVTFKYRDAEGASSYRVVSPYELVEKGYEVDGLDSLVDAFTSLICYDHGREGLRHFRIERIEGAVTFTDAEDYREPQEC